MKEVKPIILKDYVYDPKIRNFIEQKVEVREVNPDDLGKWARFLDPHKGWIEGVIDQIIYSRANGKEVMGYFSDLSPNQGIYKTVYIEIKEG